MNSTPSPPRIAAKLYPDSVVHGKALEDTALPKDFFDAAVGNIPFGNYPVFDPAYRRTPQLTRGIHDYFLAKSVDVVRPGGLIALITSRYTMDKQDSTVREHLAERAVLLGAIRLPNTAFKANAGTDVTTDILFLQKRSASVRQQGERWTDLELVDTPDGRIQVNEYFVRHSEMMLGRMGLESTQFGSAPALVGTLEPERLADAVARMPAAVYSVPHMQTAARNAGDDQIPLVGTVKEGGLADRDGQIVVRRGDELKPLKLPAATSARIRAMLQVRDAVREVFRTQLQDAPEQAITEARRFLNRSYDGFVARFGPLNSPQNVRAFAGDPDQPLLLSLEEFNPETKAATKTAIFDSPQFCARNCRVPQPSTNGAPRNVIRGEFVAKGETGWAVLCSVNNSTALLVFRNGRDTNPDRVSTNEDRTYLQGLGGDNIGYSREITAAGREFIMRHYRAYGGPEPPPIDHQGIDDAFLEKASTTWYFHHGKWLRLQGAD